MAKTTLSRTVFIGLGGFGADAILRIKSLMLDNFGEVPPMINFLAIDTDSREKVSFQNKAGKTITLNEDEHTQFTVPNVASYISNNPDITDFYHRDVLKRSSIISGGTNKLRTNGRLALIANKSISFRNILTNTISSVAHWSSSMDDKYDVAPGARTKIFVIFSLAGGTGAGMFIDLPLILRQIGIGLKNIRINAIGLQPDVFSTLGQRVPHETINAIAAMTEYELIADRKLQEFIPDPSHPARLVKTPAGSYPVDPANLYDSFILVNNESSTGVKYEALKEMADIIAKAMFLEAGATGGVGNSALDIISVLKAGQNYHGRALRYLGLGYAEMVFDPKQVAAYYSLLQTNSICNILLRPATEPKNIDEEVQQCFDEWRIQEDESRDDVINFLADNKPKQRFTEVNEFDESSAIFIKSRKESYIRRMQDDLNKSIFNPRGTLDQLTSQTINKLQSFVSEKINTQGGINYLEELLPNMIGRLKRMMDEMIEERKELEIQLGSYENIYRSKISKIDDAASISRFKIFAKRKSKIEAACEEYAAVVNSEATCIHEIERRTAAIAFYRKMIERSEDILNKVVNFEDRLRKIIESASSQIQKIKSKNPKEPYTIHVTPEYINSMKFDSSDVDINVFFYKIKLSDIALQENMDASELYSRIVGYTNSLEKTKDYLRTTLLDVLDCMPHDRVKELFIKLKRSIGILRRLDRNYPIDNATNYLIGIFDVQHSAIIDRSKKTETVDDSSDKIGKLDLNFDGGIGKEPQKTILNPGDVMRSEFMFHECFPEFSNTKDPNKISVCAYESAVPAFVIKNFEGYAYDMKRKEGFISEELRYSNKYWGDIIMKRNYSIFPQNEDNAIMAWALAFFVSKVEKDKHGKAAHQFITKAKAGEYAVFTTSGEKAMKNLHAYRPTAYEMFKQNQQWVDDILPILRQKIKDDLSTYKAKLEELKNDHQGKLYIDEYSNHNLGKTTYNSEAHENTRNLIMDELRFLTAVDITDLL